MLVFFVRYRMTLKVVFCVLLGTHLLAEVLKMYYPPAVKSFQSGEFKQCFNRMKISEKSRWLTCYIL
jgi:hypothetical protein